ncbi:MAG: CRTAC1 family protein [Planctomycetes bacterium]|nr:CRTAC1 family protein [Planctomycetota bacterium]
MKTRIAFVVGSVLSAMTAPAQDYQDVSSSTGIGFVQRGGVTTMDGGVAMFDLDNDHDLDVVVTNARQYCELFENDGTGHFTAIGPQSGLQVTRQAFGVLAVDYDNDGWTDLFVYGSGANDYLFRNNGDRTFTDVTAQAGVSDIFMTTTAGFADYDGDGWLDLYVGNYIDQPNFPYHWGAPNKLYHNEGNGTFREVAQALGVQCAGRFPQNAPFPGDTTYGCTLSVLWLDHDDDGDPDLFIGNDFGNTVVPNRLYRNDGPGGPGGPEWIFTDDSVNAGFAITEFNMGITPGDVDNDGDMDLYTSNLGNNHMLRNNGDGTFTDVTQAAGPVEGMYNGRPMVAWATSFDDIDLNGSIDLHIVNGFIDTVPMMQNDPNQPNRLWMNNGNGTFRRASLPLIEDDQVGRGLACGDLDADGRNDIVITNNSGDVRCFRNTTSTPLHWIKFLLTGTHGNRDGIGARVYVDFNGDRSRRDVIASGSYISMNAKDPHFGVGWAQRVKKATFLWPAGVEQTLYNLDSDAAYLVQEPYVDLGRAATPTIQNGWLEMPVEVTNPTATPTRVALIAGIRLVGYPIPFYLATEAIANPGASTITLRLPAPNGNLGSASGLDAELTYWLYSSNGGTSIGQTITVDQNRLTVIVP